uniref:Uncharacterized protein n=1 Tax=Spironucleus salmonicida TaxID=348837 RepID=V6LN83_9EUKA|eukprot:EST46095.1 Hypothetical protein SS50377_14086 [Spironucleus salmonicida]
MKEKQKNQYDDTLVNNEIKLHLKFSGAVRQELHFNAITCALLYQGSPLAVEGNMLHFKGRTVQLGFYPVGGTQVTHQSKDILVLYDTDQLYFYSLIQEKLLVVLPGLSGIHIVKCLAGQLFVQIGSSVLHVDLELFGVVRQFDCESPIVTFGCADGQLVVLCADGIKYEFQAARVIKTRLAEEILCGVVGAAQLAFLGDAGYSTLPLK